MTEDELKFLHRAKKMVENNPSLFGHLITACTAGIEDRVSAERKRAADFETIAAAFMAISNESRKTPTTTEWANNLIKTKMLKWEGKTCCNFDDGIEKLKA